MPCMKRVCRDKWASVYWSADSNEERSWSRWYTAGQPVMNRLSTADFVPPPLYIGFPLFVLAKNRSGQLSSKPWEARGTVGLWADRTVGTLFCPAPPRPAAVRRADPTRPKCVRVLDSTSYSHLVLTWIKFPGGGDGWWSRESYGRTCIR